MMQYYELMFEVEIAGAWYLSHIVDEQGKKVLASHFNHGTIFEPVNKLTVLPNIVGNPVDYRWTAFGAPIVSKAFGDVVEGLDSRAVQRIPVTVAPSTTGYEILNILVMLDCIDHERTKIEYYTEKDGVPEWVGRVRSMWNITIKPEKAEGHHIFRLAERWTVIMVSEILKKALEEKKFTGMKFIRLSEVNA